MAFSYASRFLRTLEQPSAYLHALESAFRDAAAGSPIPLDLRIEPLLAGRGV